MDSKIVQKRILAAQDILQRRSIDAATILSLQTLLSGINPRLDRALSAAAAAAKKVDHLQKGDAIVLAIEAIPDVSPEDKKRKKAILFFLKFWKDLQSEVARVQKEIDSGQADHSFQGRVGMLGNIFGAAKGPFGLITIAAIVVVGLKMSETSVVIRNDGCQALVPPTRVTIHIPGLVIPGQPILSGAETVATLPHLPIRADLTYPGNIGIAVAGVPYNFSGDFSGMQFIFDGKELNNATTDLHLENNKKHSLIVKCRT